LSFRDPRRADALEARARAALEGDSLPELLRMLAAIDPNGSWLPEDCEADDLPVPTLAQARSALDEMLSDSSDR
jgi:hypothetical protein